MSGLNFNLTPLFKCNYHHSTLENVSLHSSQQSTQAPASAHRNMLQSNQCLAQFHFHVVRARKLLSAITFMHSLFPLLNFHSVVLIFTLRCCQYWMPIHPGCCSMDVLLSLFLTLELWNKRKYINERGFLDFMAKKRLLLSVDFRSIFRTRQKLAFDWTQRNSTTDHLHFNITKEWINGFRLQRVNHKDFCRTANTIAVGAEKSAQWSKKKFGRFTLDRKGGAESLHYGTMTTDCDE